VIAPCETPLFFQFDPVTTDEVMDLLTKAPSKTSQLDPIPTWLQKQLSDTSSPVIASVFNYSLDAGVFPVSETKIVSGVDGAIVAYNGGLAVGRWTCDLQVADSCNIGQLSLASLRGRQIEYLFRLGVKAGFSPLLGGR